MHYQMHLGVSPEPNSTALSRPLSHAPKHRKKVPVFWSDAWKIVKTVGTIIVLTVIISGLLLTCYGLLTSPYVS